MATVALLVCVAYLWRQRPPSQPVADVAPPVSSAPAPASAPAQDSKTHYPLDIKAATPPTSAAVFDLQAALADLFGLNTVQSLFRLDDFSRRLAATLDNLGRSHAPATLWPVNPVSGRFTVEQRDGATFIGADNGLRYTPYVLLLETVDLRQAVALYARIYPALQRAYEDLGYPREYLNDRLVQVIDQLLATPEIDVPLQVRLPPIEGPLRPERPWVLYEFVDAELQSLTAGQRALLRMGSVNERRIKVRLAEIRRLVTAGRSTR
ncbi:MAG: DUF3014 domain-containing protein [Burkholderiales bacterium]|nr:DUF3014 domain-containing protein [Burkholderiales bacterium]